MNKRFQLLATVLLAILFSLDCKAQNINEHDMAVLKKIGSTPKSASYLFKLGNLNMNGNVTSVSFQKIEGEIDSLLELGHLKSIRLDEMKSGWLPQIAKRYPSLEGLAFNATLVTADDLASLGELKNLSRLVINGGDFDGAACMRKIGGLTELVSLTIPLGWERFAFELKDLKKLYSLRSEGSDWLSEDNYQKHLDHGNYQHFYRLLVDEQKRSVVEASEVLGILGYKNRVTVINMSEQLVPYLNKIDTANILDLKFGELSNDKFDEFEIPSGVKELILSGNVSSNFLEKFTRLGSLERLSLDGLKQPSIHRFSDFNDLKLDRLTISDCTFRKDGLSWLTKLKGLKRLDLWNNQWAGADFSFISELKALEHFSLSGKKIPFKDSDLKYLQNLKSLNQLSLRSTQTTAESRFNLYRILKLTPLQWLDSEGARVVSGGKRLLIRGDVEVSDELVSAVAQIESLSKIIVSSNQADVVKVVSAHPFEVVQLNNCELLSDEAIELLSTKQNIKSLRISGENLVTDEGFQFLERMHWLKEFRYSGTGVSEAAQEALKTKLPNCKIN